MAVNPQLHLFEICLFIDKDIENDSIFGENVLQELEDRARSLKAFRYMSTGCDSFCKAYA